MKPQIVTANRLHDGLVVYLSAGDEWSERIEDSRLAADEAEGEALMAVAVEAVTVLRVVDPYLIEVDRRDEAIVPVRYREVIRAVGPSVHPDFCKDVAGIPALKE